MFGKEKYQLFVSSAIGLYFEVFQIKSWWKDSG
jgi:hypothetical protein